LGNDCTYSDYIIHFTDNGFCLNFNSGSAKAGNENFILILLDKSSILLYTIKGSNAEYPI